MTVAGDSVAHEVGEGDEEEGVEVRGELFSSRAIFSGEEEVIGLLVILEEKL